MFNIILWAQNPPEWSRDAIWYQILPERFYNGDLDNDPTKESLYGVWPWEYQSDWQVSPWTADWYYFQPWEEANGQHFRYQFQIRRYGGDLQGILVKLDYLQEIGINAIYLNPIFQSPSSHKYGAETYRHVDRFFGPDPGGDLQIMKEENPVDPATWRWTAADRLFLELINEIHRRNMHIIIDGVFNHVGLTFWAFQDVIKQRENSPYYNWFNIQGSAGADLSHLNEFQTLPDFFLGDNSEPIEYTGYVADLPAFRQDSDGPVKPVRDHLHNIIRRWGDPNGDGDPSDGIDGWRLDVAERIQLNFWKTFHTWVKEINPDAYITGEIWWENYWDNIQFNAAPWLEEGVFDAVMNYRFGDAMFKFFLDEKQQITPSELDDILNTIRFDYHPETAYVLQNLLDSHDMERLASAAANSDRWMDHGNNLQYNPDFKIGPPDQTGWSKVKAILAFQFTYPGSPYIYYGDEVGMWGADDPDCRKPMVWAEFEYADETTHPCERLPDCSYRRDRDKVDINQDILSTYKALIKIRNEYSALTQGTYQTVLTADETGLFAFRRIYNNEIILAVFNSSKIYQEIPEDILIQNKWQLVFDSESGPEISHQLKPNSAKIFRTSL